jgi:hypothetical protein
VPRFSFYWSHTGHGSTTGLDDDPKHHHGDGDPTASDGLYSLDQPNFAVFSGNDPNVLVTTYDPAWYLFTEAGKTGDQAGVATSNNIPEYFGKYLLKSARRSENKAWPKSEPSRHGEGAPCVQYRHDLNPLCDALRHKPREKLRQNRECRRPLACQSSQQFFLSLSVARHHCTCS